jgi:uncharacterized protein
MVHHNQLPALHSRQLDPRGSRTAGPKPTQASKPSASLSAEEARGVTLRAQGFGDRRLAEPIDVLEHLGAIQLDSVNVVARSHELVPASRLGPTSLRSMLRSVYEERRAFEYWGHAASWLPISYYPYFRPRMVRFGERWSSVRADHGHLVSEILDRIRAEGPLGSADFEAPRTGRIGWWDWKPAKLVLEYLFATGQLMSAQRANGFARLYDLPERVLPPDLDTSDPGERAAERFLLRRAVEALGIATAVDAADYFRLQAGQWRGTLRDLTESGEVVEVAVEGWPALGYATPAALAGILTPPDHPPALLSPFDNLVWERHRAERLFGFRYRIEIYVPEGKRQYGYYVLPLLARGQLLGRVDVKLDRERSVLRARTVWLEGATPEEAVSALRDLARHLGAGTIDVERVMPEGNGDAVSIHIG